MTTRQALPLCSKSPDGSVLAWTSSRHSDGGRGSGQIFVADWNHEKALELLERGIGLDHVQAVRQPGPGGRELGVYGQ